MRYSARLVAIVTLVAGGGIVACGSDSRSADDTLPPIVTTTTTTTVPPTTTTIPETYTIQSGDSLFTIAQMFGLSSAELAVYNGIVNKDHIEVGQVLKIPQPGETTTTVTTLVGVTVDPGSTTSVP